MCRSADNKGAGSDTRFCYFDYILKLILAIRRLRASCKEEVVADTEKEKFFCVTDIPYKDLPSHAPY